VRPLEGKVALVTGSGRGIGLAVAERLAAAGAAVVVNDLEPDTAESAAGSVRAHGAGAVAVTGDVTDPGLPAELVAAAVDGLGGLDIIVNNAGYTWDGVIQHMSDEQWDAMLAVHATAPFRILRAAHPHLRDRAAAESAAGVPVTRKVVNTTSISGTEGNPGQVNYSAAKAAVIGLTRALAKEWGRYRVTVNAVGFGLIRTRMTESREFHDGRHRVADREVRMGVEPEHLKRIEERIPLGRAGTPAEAAGATYLLCLPESDYVTGEVLICGGGYHF
jgi:3-oxoacyl-[acyl-carrier protein] reductase